MVKNNFINQKRLERAFRKVEREQILHKQFGKCKYCRDVLTIKTTTIDHRIPKSKGGRDTKKNYVASCGYCNWVKAAADEKEFMAIIDAPTPPRRPYLTIWMSRRLNLRTEKALRRISRYTGVPYRF